MCRHWGERKEEVGCRGPRVLGSSQFTVFLTPVTLVPNMPAEASLVSLSLSPGGWSLESTQLYLTPPR